MKTQKQTKKEIHQQHDNGTHETSVTSDPPAELLKQLEAHLVGESLADAQQSPAIAIAKPIGKPITLPPVKAPTDLSELDTNDAISRWRIEALKRRHRADAFFNRLTFEQQYALCEWFEDLTIPEIQQRIAAPSPQGWALEISQTVLRRTRALLRAIDLTSSTEEMLDTISDLQSDSDLSQGPRIQNALVHLLNKRAFEFAIDQPDSEVLNDLVANIRSLSTLEFKRQQLDLQREKLRLIQQSTHTQRKHRVDLHVFPNKAGEDSAPAHIGSGVPTETPILVDFKSAQNPENPVQ